jgi:hypothetical protein
VAKARWLICAQRSLLDQQRQTVSIIDLLDTLTLSGPPPPEAGPLPTLPLEYVVVSLWERDNENVPEVQRIRFNIIGPDDTVLGTQEAEVDLRPLSRARLIIGAYGLPFAGPGKYSVRLDVPDGAGWKPAIEDWFNVAVANTGASLMPAVGLLTKN